MADNQAKRNVVGQTAEIAPGQRKVVEIDGRQIGVFNIDGSYYALFNRCPHRAGPLCHGRLRPLVVSGEDGAVEYQREGEILKCPWHHGSSTSKPARAHLRRKTARAHLSRRRRGGGCRALYLNTEF
ncbi:MAG: Rieske 2Fe-2S domain-containing protein [Caldilineaceae bacterium]|nr:Rieske 2Fe-2S domain-containing protein [Caldilineaceae bacterium]